MVPNIQLYDLKVKSIKLLLLAGETLNNEHENELCIELLCNKTEHVGK